MILEVFFKLNDSKIEYFEHLKNQIKSIEDVKILKSSLH